MTYLRVRILISYLDCPDSCAGADVEDSTRFLANGGKVQLVIAAKQDYVMAYVETVKLGLCIVSLSTDLSD